MIRKLHTNAFLLFTCTSMLASACVSGPTPEQQSAIDILESEQNEADEVLASVTESPNFAANTKPQASWEKLSIGPKAWQKELSQDPFREDE